MLNQEKIGELSTQDLLNEWLSTIDEILSKNRVALSSRPFIAAELIIEHAIVKIDSEDRHNYSDHLFMVFLRFINSWYKERFGELLEGKNSLLGLVFFKNQPFLLSFPYSKSIDLGLEKSFSVIFMKKYRNDMECWKDYLDIPPCFQKYNNLNELERYVILELERQRCLFHNTIPINHERAKNLLHTIKDHLDSSILYIIEAVRSEKSFNLAYWELLMALEKMIKALLIQKNIKYPKTHDIHKLLRMLDIENIGIYENALSSFPNSATILSMRYGELNEFSIEKIKYDYNTTMDTLVYLSTHINRSFTINDEGATIYMKKPTDISVTLGW